ncbi:BglG family transcription antiterminator [Lactococcus fujiensis]|uniref:Transcriptional antiterminator n=1 Tax=Lactococcus fujiensis JCM 16395 TaxID=1291764 RepID=A0A2A5RJ84_9LACT|nr:transcription antiterminator [Lactococcus fujiensis]PCR99156.1 transcriptional antiterminator [Lactococcus fujiensis JCM 16395]
MIITSREQKLIQAFISQGSLTIAEMLKVTETSRRTLYRDLEKLQNSLPSGIELRTDDEGYSLKGDLSVLINAQELIEYSVTERLFGELLMLIDNKASILTLTEKFGISQPTVTSDLRLIQSVLNENGLYLKREQGLEIEGNEEKIRSVLVSSLNAISHISDILTGEISENKLISLLDLEQLLIAREAFQKVDLPEMTDKTQALMQLFFTASLLRLQQGKTVSTDGVRRPSKAALAFVNHLISNLQTRAFTISEITYLAVVYDVLYFGFGREVLFMEKFDSDFSYKIRKLIDTVSMELGLQFSKDDRLYGLLYAHLKETDLLPDLFSEKQSDFVKNIESDNPKVYDVVKQSLPSVFKKNFSSMEVAFVTMHFVATLERSDLVFPLRSALVTNRGWISCELLMSSLRKNFPFLKKIDLIQPSFDFDKTRYDVIFTTETNLEDYIYVNRTLEQNNLDEIRHKLRAIQQNTKPVISDESEKEFVNLNQLFSIGNSILTDFEIVNLENRSSLTDVVNQVVTHVNTSNPSELAYVLKKRFDETHLAIPETKIALLHGVHKTVEAPLFQIFDLSQEIEVMAMNRKMIRINRVLLLLSPPEVADYAAYLLGKISSSIIENKLYTTIYSSGNYAVVIELLRQIITESIRKYGE